MTIQECCGGISSDNTDITEGSTPYMIRKCINKDSWSKNNCAENCCDMDSYCIPTEQGGFCYNSNDNKYFTYRGGGRINQDGLRDESNEKFFITEVNARHQYPYMHNNEFEFETEHSRSEFDDRRYDRSYVQAKRDILNNYMENNIKNQNTDFKKDTTVVNQPFMTPTTNVILLIIIIFVVICLINYIATVNKFRRLKYMFY